MYAELHAKTNFSFLEGASHPDELICRAAELGYRALAITDRNSLAGVVRAHGAAKEAGREIDRRRGDHARRRPAGGAVGDGSRRLRPARAADHPGPSPRGKRGMPAWVSTTSPSMRKGFWRESGERGERERGEGDDERDWRVQTDRRRISRRSSTRPLATSPHSPLSPLLSHLSSLSRTATCSPTAATCWPNCTAGRTIGGNGSSCSSSRGRRAFRWWRPATCIITCRSEPSCTTC